MAYLLDTGVLLRLVDLGDKHHSTVRHAVRLLGDRNESVFIATQNMAEFYNVATRPVTHNGLGLSSIETIELLEDDIEPICGIVAESAPVYGEVKRLVAKYAVAGKQVHDARLVALMLVWQIENVLTLNDRHFRRFEPEGITVVTPAAIVS